MAKRLDVTGQRFGRLVAIERLQSKHGRSVWLFRCDCGALIEARLENVKAKSHATMSCGCQRKDVTRARSLKHGHHVGRQESRTLKSYSHAKARCQNPNDPKFPLYGGRGILMCDAWAQDFNVFLADMGECPEGMTLDRIDPNKGYEPGNCRWADSFQQARTRTDNVIVHHNGQDMILKDFAALMGVPYKSLHAYIKYRGFTPHAAAERLAR